MPTSISLRLQAVDDELGNTLVATMLYLDSENKKDINMYINASGGDVVPCLALHDTMKHIGSDVATVGFGGVMGMSGFLLACGMSAFSLLSHSAALVGPPPPPPCCMQYADPLLDPTFACSLCLVP
jgi:ATP-dependent Clp endopeptidase proteolytic subunit ClpP